jgi:hypothetical protein
MCDIQQKKADPWDNRQTPAIAIDRLKISRGSSTDKEKIELSSATCRHSPRHLYHKIVMNAIGRKINGG